MTVVAEWPLSADPITPRLPIVVPTQSNTQQLAEQPQIGMGLLRPLRREQKIDFASGEGADLINAAIGQIMGTRAQSEFSQGELPWRTEFGSLLHLIRQNLNSPALADLARKHTVDALRRWEPRIRVTRVKVTRESTSAKKLDVTRVSIFWRLVAERQSANLVRTPDLETTVLVR